MAIQHKIILIIQYFILFIVLSPSTAFSAGEFCCPVGYNYMPSHNMCSRPSQMYTVVDPVNCHENEKCAGGIGTDGPDRGICTETDSVTKCCSVGVWNKSKKICQMQTQGGIVEQKNVCSAEEKCINDWCVVGIETTLEVFNICEGLNGDQLEQCTNCLGNEEDRGVWTALGCIHVNPSSFIADFLKIAIGIAGGIALLLMGYGSFLISTSAGDPKKSEEGKEIITGTIAGLLFIIFSVFLLRFIGVEILSIPGL
jgi:hypothetical protein